MAAGAAPPSPSAVCLWRPRFIRSQSLRTSSGEGTCSPLRCTLGSQPLVQTDRLVGDFAPTSHLQGTRCCLAVGPLTPSWLPPSLPPRSGPPRGGSTRSSLCMTHRVPRDPQVTSQPGSWTAESLAALPVASSPTSSTLASGKPHWHPIFSRLGRGDVWPAEHGDCPPGPTRAAPACPFRPPASLRPDPSARAPDAADRRCTAEAGAAAPCTPVLQPRPVPDSGESSKLLAR